MLIKSFLFFTSGLLFVLKNRVCQPRPGPAASWDCYVTAIPGGGGLLSHSFGVHVCMRSRLPRMPANAVEFYIPSSSTISWWHLCACADAPLVSSSSQMPERAQVFLFTGRAKEGWWDVIQKQIDSTLLNN